VALRLIVDREMEIEAFRPREYWTVKALLTSAMAWPALGLAMLVAGPIALLPIGRFFLGSAVGGGLLYNLILLVA
jgi:hypothetical protein